MSKQVKKALLPELRFPEFRKRREWSEEPLGKVCKMKAGTFVQASDIYEKNNEDLFPCYGGNGLRGFTRSYTHEGTYPLIGRQGAHCGNVVWAEGRFHATEHAVVATPNEGVNTRWLYHVLDHAHLNQYATGQAQPGLSVEGLEKVEIPFTDDPDEQQKIAACLSSVDALLAAEREKLEALRAHKKGLMQQLFPAEGTKVPELRFPGFGGEWVESELGKSLTGQPEYGINAPAVPFSEELPTYLRITDISEEGRFLATNKVSVAQVVSEQNYLQDGDIVLARTGASVGKSYKYRSADGPLVFAGFLIRVRPNPKVLVSEYLNQFLSTAKYWKWVNFISARSGQPGINGTEYASMPLPIPPTAKEQKEIAGCLAALDDGIALQGERIEAIEQHKKGLMQGLFPVSN